MVHCFTVGARRMPGTSWVLGGGSDLVPVGCLGSCTDLGVLRGEQAEAAHTSPPVVHLELCSLWKMWVTVKSMQTAHPGHCSVSRKTAGCAWPYAAACGDVDSYTEQYK